MMKLTNKLNLPQPIVDAIKNDEYSRGDADISVTQLIAPPRQVALKEKHASEIEEDASDRIYSLLGQSIHTILERANKTGIAERRLAINVGGWKLSGAMDLYFESGSLSDYKVTTAYKFKDGGVPFDFEAQLNICAEILRQHGEKVNELFVIAILRDWSKPEALRSADFPQRQVIIRAAPLWTTEKAKAYIEERIEIHQKARRLLPLCTMEERWGKLDTFAVYKQGGKRAVRLYDSEEAAQGHVSQDAGLFITRRVGDSTRCRHYCSVNTFCEQWKALSFMDFRIEDVGAISLAEMRIVK